LLAICASPPMAFGFISISCLVILRSGLARNLNECLRHLSLNRVSLTSCEMYQAFLKWFVSELET
jgi:hypothetical protein